MKDQIRSVIEARYPHHADQDGILAAALEQLSIVAAEEGFKAYESAKMQREQAERLAAADARETALLNDYRASSEGEKYFKTLDAIAMLSKYERLLEILPPDEAQAAVKVENFAELFALGNAHRAELKQKNLPDDTPPLPPIPRDPKAMPAAMHRKRQMVLDGIERSRAVIKSADSIDTDNTRRVQWR